MCYWSTDTIWHLFTTWKLLFVVVLVITFVFPVWFLACGFDSGLPLPMPYRAPYARRPKGRNAALRPPNRHNLRCRVSVFSSHTTGSPSWPWAQRTDGQQNHFSRFWDSQFTIHVCHIALYWNSCEKDGKGASFFLGPSSCPGREAVGTSQRVGRTQRRDMGIHGVNSRVNSGKRTLKIFEETTKMV